MTSSTKSRLVILALGAMLFAGMDVGCRVLTSTEDCTTDADCSGAERCHPEGRYCEKLTAVHVGVVLGLTGGLQALAESALESMRLAADIVNEGGGVLGAKIVLDVLDDEGDDTLAETHTRTLVAKNVAGVIGPMRSSQVLKAQAVTYGARVLHLSPVGGAGALAASQPAKDRYLFQTITSIRKGSASAIVRYAVKPVDDPPRAQPACRTMAVLHTDDITGNEYASAITALMPKQDACVTLDIAFPPTKKASYAEDVSKLVAAKPDCAALVALPPIGAAILREFATQKAADKAHDWSMFTFYGTSTLHSPDFLAEARADKNMATPTFAEGFMGADVDGAPPTADYADFRFEWQQRLARTTEPPNLTAHAFDAMVVMALAIAKARSAHDRVAIRDAFYDVTRDGDRVPAYGPGNVLEALAAVRRGERVNYQGASGGIEPDDTGVVVDPTIIWAVKNGAFVQPVVRYSEAQMQAIDVLREGRSCP